MGSIYHCSMEPEEEKVLKQLRDKISVAGPGVTLTGNRLTVRWNMEGQLVDAHMIVESVTTPEEARKHTEVSEIEKKVWSQHREEAAEICKIETGEYPE